jgi:hypothetical protein
MYGVTMAKLPVGDIGYQPPSPVHAGQLLTFTAELPQGMIYSASVNAGAAWNELQLVTLLDDGVLPDQTAGDRTFTGQLKWKAEYGTGEVVVKFVAFGKLDRIDAVVQEQLPELTVLP